MRILIVDDKEESRYLLEVLLKGSGHDVTATSNGAEAIEKLKSGKFDLIISDILMPVMDGFELCRKIRKDEALRHIPFIIYTATYTGPEDEVFALKIGADRFLQKPSEPEELVSAIEEVMAKAGHREIYSLPGEEKEAYRVYSERLVRKLEQKAMELEQEVQARKEAERIAQASAEKWQITFDAILDPVALFKTDCTVTQCNRAFADFVGRDPQVLVGEKCFRLVHRTEENIEDCPLLRSLKSGMEETLEMSLDQKTFLVVVDPLKDSDGKISGFVHIMHDITEQKRAEKALQQSEERYRMLVEESFDGIFIQKGQKIIYANQQLCKMLGYDIGEMEGMDHWLVYHPDYQELTRERAKARMRGEQVPSQYEVKIQRKDGSAFDGEILAKRIMFGDEPGIQVWLRDLTERKKAEEALRESERKFRDIVLNLDEGYYSVTLDGTLLEHNRAFNRILEFPPDQDLRGIKLPDFWQNPDDRQDYLKALISDGSISNYLVNAKTQKGNKITVVVSAHIVKDENNRPQRIEGVFLDLTERKKAEEALKESEIRFRAFFEQAGVGVAIIETPTGRFCHINQKYCDIVGYSLEEMRATTFQAITHPDDLKADLDNMERLKKGQISQFSMEKRYYHKSGRVVWVNLTVTPLWQVSEPTSFHIAVVEDITERKRIEEELEASEKRFRELFDEAPVGYHELDKEGRITRVNRTELEMLGYTADEMVGRYVYEFIKDEISSQSVKGKLAGERPVEPSFERTYIRKDGTVIPVILEERILKDSEGRIAGIRTTMQDITERKRVEQEMALLQEQLRQAQKMEAIGRLAGGIAHDFNNLLTVIKGTCQLSLLDLREGDPLRANLKEIERSAETAADLTRQLLAFSRKQIMEMRVIDINTVIKNLEKMLRRIIGEDIELVIFLTDGVGRVKVDPAQIEQAIINIIVNARDAMPEGGKLTIETANVELDEAYAKRHIEVKPGPYVMLSISDTGVGMTPEMKEKVFEPFFTTKEVGKGTGLGLSTVYGIVKQSGGNIWVYSEPGQGTTFKIYLPRVEGPLEDLGEKTIKEAPQGSETVLVVEDDETVRKLAIRILKMQGYKVLEASEGGRAFLLCEEYKDPIHLILSDVVMPGMSGRKLVERLKRIHPEAKVLYMSGYTGNVILHHGILEEGIEFIQKPFTVETLARKVREVLDK